MKQEHIEKIVAITKEMKINPSIEIQSFTEECLDILDVAVEYDLLFEVLWSAFQHKTNFPNASMLQSLQVGANEWDI
jgi:hypothetical protein